MEWLAQFFDKAFSIVPRIWLTDPDEGGVRVTPKLRGGMRVKVLGPGWNFYWPVLQTCHKIKVVTQVVDLRPQSVWTADKIELVISGCIKYRVTSAKDAILSVFDYDANIKTLALGIIFDYVTGHQSEEIDIVALKIDILKGLRETSRGWGLKIDAIYLTDIGAVKNLRLLMNEPMFGIKE